MCDIGGGVEVGVVVTFLCHQYGIAYSVQRKGVKRANAAKMVCTRINSFLKTAPERDGDSGNNLDVLS